MKKEKLRIATKMEKINDQEKESITTTKEKKRKTIIIAV
jgi:hypothetical protein